MLSDLNKIKINGNRNSEIKKSSKKAAKFKSRGTKKFDAPYHYSGVLQASTVFVSMVTSTRYNNKTSDADLNNIKNDEAAVFRS